MAAMGGLVPLLGLREVPPGGLEMLAVAVALNVLLAAAVFSLLSPLCGGAKEPAMGVILMLLGINSAWFQEHANLWLRRAEALLPPLFASTPTAWHGMPEEETGMRIKLSSVFVDDQDRALQFYTEVLGFVKKHEIPVGDAKFLTVVSPEEPDGTELLLEPNDNPAARTYQAAIFAQGIPATAFSVGVRP